MIIDKQKKLAILIIIIALVGAVGYSVWAGRSSKFISLQDEKAINDRSEVKIFRSVGATYKFNYPVDWKMVTPEEGVLDRMIFLTPDYSLGVLQDDRPEYSTMVIEKGALFYIQDAGLAELDKGNWKDKALEKGVAHPSAQAEQKSINGRPVVFRTFFGLVAIHHEEAVFADDQNYEVVRVGFYSSSKNEDEIKKFEANLSLLAQSYKRLKTFRNNGTQVFSE